MKSSSYDRTPSGMVHVSRSIDRSYRGRTGRHHFTTFEQSRSVSPADLPLHMAANANSQTLPTQHARNREDEEPASPPSETSFLRTFPPPVRLRRRFHVPHQHPFTFVHEISQALMRNDLRSGVTGQTEDQIHTGPWYRSRLHAWWGDGASLRHP